ncbi:MAG: hypothetical protein K0S76_577 [Herbinix sp.]|jgi:LCP family protein required for cell wall assembly|nr:hypothetical protein [Herbinix sp.]
MELIHRKEIAMSKVKSKNIKRKGIFIVIRIIGILLLLVTFSSYLLIRGYIDKINIIDTQSNAYASNSLTKPLFQAVVETAEEIEQNPYGEYWIRDQTGEEVCAEQTEATGDSLEEEIKTLEDRIEINLADQAQSKEVDQDVINILFIGSDTREAGDIGRSDAIILISISKRNKTITATSILRDIYLQIPGCGKNRINTAYAYGGADLLMETVEQNFKIPVDRFVSVDFFSFIDIVDAIGGVTLPVTEAEIPVINFYIEEINKLSGEEADQDQLHKEGLLLLNGKQALGYSRNRYVGNADFERTNRQRQVLEQIYLAIKDSNLLELNQLLNIILPGVTTNLTEGELFAFILSLPIYKDYELKQFRIPMKDTYTDMRIQGKQVLGIDFEKNIDALWTKIYGAVINEGQQ